MVKEIFDFSNGKIAFFVPFVYDEIDTFWNKYWDEYFQEIDSNDSKIRSAAYVNGKNEIIGKLKEKESSLFKNAQACISNCPINKKDYNGKECQCDKQVLVSANPFYYIAYAVVHRKLFLCYFLPLLRYKKNSIYGVIFSYFFLSSHTFRQQIVMTLLYTQKENNIIWIIT